MKDHRINVDLHPQRKFSFPKFINKIHSASVTLSSDLKITLKRNGESSLSLMLASNRRDTMTKNNLIKYSLLSENRRDISEKGFHLI